MSNIKMIHEFVEDATITMSTSENSSYPMANLKDRNPNHLWKGGSTAQNQTITFDCGSARTVDTVVVDGVNFLACAADIGIQWRSSTDNVTFTTRGSFAAATNTKEKLEISSLAARYWQIKFTGTAALGAIPQIGNIAFGTRVELFPYNNGAKLSDAHATKTRVSINGTKYMVQSYKGFKRWSLKWTLLTDTERNNILAMNRSVRGKYFPFYFCDFDDSINLVQFMNDEQQIELTRYNQNNTQDIGIEAFPVNT